MGSEYVYVIYENENTFKIGRSKNVSRRIKSYKTHNSSINGYLAIFEVNDSKLAESSLHRVYSKYCIKGEFFELPVKELKKLESNIIGLKKSYLSQQYLEFINL